MGSFRAWHRFHLQALLTVSEAGGQLFLRNNLGRTKADVIVRRFRLVVDWLDSLWRETPDAGVREALEKGSNPFATITREKVGRGRPFVVYLLYRERRSYPDDRQEMKLFRRLDDIHDVTFLCHRKRLVDHGFGTGQPPLDF
jgi:hypothetical protein